MSAARLLGLVREAGVAIPIDQQALSALAERINASEDVSGEIVARGRAPVPGTDGRVEFFFEGREAVGTELEDGRIDFQERGAIASAAAGDLLARVHPPGRGQAGVDVRGATLPARDGNRASLRRGKNVDPSEDGLEFRAAIAGRILLDHDHLSVSEVYSVADVDLSTGNLRIENGSIRVAGTIRSGFEVRAPEDIEVEKTIESARVEAGRDVNVGRGIIMKEGDDGRVVAGRNVTARFAQSARIEAGQDIVVDNDLTRCNLVAGGRVLATAGKGRILGGRIEACGGVEANEIGSDSGTRTEIVIGAPDDAMTPLQSERDEMQALVHKIDQAIGTGEPREILERTAPERRPAVVALIQKRAVATRRIEELDPQLATLIRTRAQRIRARIKVRLQIHPGTVIAFGKVEMHVKRPISNSQVFFDAEKREIRWSPL